MNMEILVALVLLTLITITANTIIITRTWRVSIEQKREQSVAQSSYYLASVPINLNELEILDKIIQDDFERYQILNLAHKDNLYITEEIQQKIIMDIATEVFKSISQNIWDKLALIYKKEHLEDIIVQKVQMIVLTYTVEINGNYKDDKK